MKRVYVVGGGSSLSDFDFKKLQGVDTIVTNMAFFNVPDPNYFVTIDYSWLSKISKEEHNQFKYSNTQKFFIACMALGSLKYVDGAITDIKNDIKYNLGDFDAILHSTQVGGLGYRWNDFRNGLNSGYCAVQLASLLGYDEIYLLGIDMTVDSGAHYHDRYTSTSSNIKNMIGVYEWHFKEMLQQSSQKIISCSPISTLNKYIEYIPIEKVLNDRR